jgi:thymidylate synthase ThyX
MNKSQRVLTVAPMPPEKIAYALARYSRSPDSIMESIEWVRSHDSSKFLESFYFQYGHASIADLGHVVLCLEGISELAATEVEDEPLWDGQARSSRYQDFGKSGFIVPPEFDQEQKSVYSAGAEALMRAYRAVHQGATEILREALPKPAEMKLEAYARNVAARAFDVARYCLFFGVPTGVGQVVSIRTLEKQIRRLRGSEYEELRSLGAEMAEACAQPPRCTWDMSKNDPVAPTLAKYVEPDESRRNLQQDLRLWATQNLSLPGSPFIEDVVLSRPAEPLADIAATLLYIVTDHPYRLLYETVLEWSEERRIEILDIALQRRGKRDELPREFRGGNYVFDIVMDIGAYRDLHRHRRCVQFRQSYSHRLGFSQPAILAGTSLDSIYREAMQTAFAYIDQLPAPGSHYLLPFAARGRFLFKMDFAELEYIARLRSGVKGHASYREIAWKMREALARVDPALYRFTEATPPWIEDLLKR